MSRVQLIHWHAAEAEERAARLRAAGYEVACEVPQGADFSRKLGQNPPVAVIVDLARLPSHGRDLGLVLRKQASTRRVPLLFVGGDPEKAARIHELLPDAVYTSWAEIGSALAQAIAHPPADPIVPRSQFEAYADKPLVGKLGIKAGSAVALVDPPPDFRETLGELPVGAVVREGIGEPCDLIVWFVRTSQELQRRIEGMADRVAQGGLWIAWPKRASGVSTDLSQQPVREAGLAAGLVDYKICSMDATWSGLLFRRRKAG